MLCARPALTPKLFVSPPTPPLPSKKKLNQTKTTNSVLDAALFDRVTPRSVLTWQRAVAANWLARGGAEWAAYFATHASGTYNNQW